MNTERLSTDKIEADFGRKKKRQWRAKSADWTTRINFYRNGSDEEALKTAD